MGVKLLRLYFSTQHGLKPWYLANLGFEESLYWLVALAQRGAPIEIVDTSTVNEEKLRQAYHDAVRASLSKKHKIRRIFGTKRISGFWFGKEVPALIVYGNEDKPVMVYPYMGGGSGFVTILDFLKDAFSAFGYKWIPPRSGYRRPTAPRRKAT